MPASTSKPKAADEGPFAMKLGAAKDYSKIGRAAAASGNMSQTPGLNPNSDSRLPNEKG